MVGMLLKLDFIEKVRCRRSNENCKNILKKYKKIGKIGKEQGLLWGANWMILKDYPHFEYPIHRDSVSFIPIPDVVIIPID